MGPLMYRQRPAFPALIFSACVLIAGGLIAVWANRQVEEGLKDESTLILIIFSTLGLAGCGLVAAFARYQYTHLWQKKRHPDADESASIKQSRGRW
ncbi:hypothetical protein P4B35_02910 [Pontiellaceae bacterium B12227]|nr:hypothetical protein [Pontiellaceae bacterium B12227]